jgi:hypothetical protein
MEDCGAEGESMADEHTVPSESDVLFNLVLQRYGQRLTSDARQEVRKGIEGIARARQALKSVALANSDEPFWCFTPYRKD